MTFTDGWYSAAARADAFPGRIGGGIVPFAGVVHTTDMAPETFTALVASWQQQLAGGDCAHFLIGRDPSQGVKQFATVFRNANHAGGPHHGAFVDAKANVYHPNLVAVGIELHCAGGVQRIGGEWRLVEGGKPTGAPIDDLDVDPDPARPGRGWHRVTDWQYQQLDALLTDLGTVLAPAPTGLVAKSTFQTPPAWALGAGRFVGHCSLDFLERSDPWPKVMEWLRSRTSAA